jgi:hypothetical protein
MRPTPQGFDVHSVVDGGAIGAVNNFLEMANYAEHPQVVDVRYVHNTPHPIFAPERRSEFVLDMIRAQRSAFRQVVALCEAQGLSDTLQVADDKLRAMALELYKALTGQKLLPVIFEAMHAEEETEQLRRLKSIA